METDKYNSRRKNPPVDRGSGLWTSTPKVLGNLHQLLRSTYFGNWPLTVRFLSTDAHSHWQRWSERADGLLPDTIHIELDFRAEGASVLDSTLPANDMSHMDATYRGIQEHLEKSMALLANNPKTLSCEVCKEQLFPQNDIIVVCSGRYCHAVSHVSCLSQLFLHDEGSSGLVPAVGECPACKREVKWVTLMKELTMRLYGAKQVTKLLKRQHGIQASKKGPKSGKQSKTDGETLDNDYEDLDENWMNAVNVESSSMPANCESSNAKKPVGRVEIVIEDTEEEIF